MYAESGVDARAPSRSGVNVVWTVGAAASDENAEIVAA
jgi:hypothetical protein